MVSLKIYNSTMPLLRLVGTYSEVINQDANGDESLEDSIFEEMESDRSIVAMFAKVFAFEKQSTGKLIGG